MTPIIPVDPVERWMALPVHEQRKRLGLRKLGVPQDPLLTPRERRLLAKYNLMGSQWRRLFRNQMSRCAICKTEKPGSIAGWATDHCHVTGRVRGILCLKCNTGIGHFDDNPFLMQAAIDYLRKSDAH